MFYLLAGAIICGLLSVYCYVMGLMAEYAFKILLDKEPAFWIDMIIGGVFSFITFVPTFQNNNFLFVGITTL